MRRVVRSTCAWGGPAAVDPGGVTSRATEDGTYFSHDSNRLIGGVPHVASDRDDN